MFSWEIYARCFTHTVLDPRDFRTTRQHLGIGGLKKKIESSVFFLSDFDNLRLLGMIHIVDAPKFHIPLPIISQRGKKANKEKNGWHLPEKSASKQLRFWRQQHFCSAPTGGGTQIYFNHEMCGGMPSGQIIATSHGSLTPKRWLRKGNGTPKISGTSR